MITLLSAAELIGGAVFLAAVLGADEAIVRARRRRAELDARRAREEYLFWLGIIPSLDSEKGKQS